MKAFVEHSLIKPGTVEKRLYQEVIVARALEQGNTLVVAPTALGKTVIALLLSAHVLEKQEKAKILFLSPTRPLALQHSESFKRFLNIQEQEITLLDGHVEKEKRKQEWEKAKIVCATPQTIENDIITSNISLHDCSLCIFDECHRASGNYSYVFIARELQKNKNSTLILALTASPGATEEKIQEVCQNLFIKNIEIKTPTDTDVAPYTKETETEWRTTFLPESFLEIRRHFDSFMKENLEALKKIGIAKTANIKFYSKTRLLEMQSQLRKRLSQYGNRQPYLFQAATKCAMLMKVSHAVTLLETQGINALVIYLEKMHKKSFHSGATKALKQMFANQNMQYAFNLARQLKEKGIDHPKKELLKKIILMELKNNPDGRIIVFNHYRDSIKNLVAFLNEIDGIRAERFVGQAAKENEKGLSQKQQSKIIQEFREGKFNVIVASSVHPEEFIIIKNDSTNQIEIKKIGEFVDSFIPDEPITSKVTEVSGYSALSFDGNETKFLPLTHVHKHALQSEVVEIVLSSGFRTMVTRDHSFFTFNQASNLVPSTPKENMFAKICLTAPNVQEPKTLDLAKEFYQNLPLNFKKRIYCSMAGLSQPLMRILSSNRKFLKVIYQQPTTVKKISQESALDLSTVVSVIKRLKAGGKIISKKFGRYNSIIIAPDGLEYYKFLEWFFQNLQYYKKKYRFSLESIIKTELKIEKYGQFFIEAKYGKIKLPRFLEVNPPLAELLGLYVAEGDARNTLSTAGIHLAARKKEMQERMAKCVREGLGIKPSVTWRGIDINSKLAYYLINYVFRAGIGACNKEVPSIIFSLPDEHKWRFFEGYTRGDGYITSKRIVLTTCSKKLATGLIFLLRQLGIKKITLQKSSKRSTFDIHVMESVPFQEIYINGKKCYYDLIPIAQSNQKTFTLMQNKFLSRNSGGITRKVGKVVEQNCFDYIKKIKPLKEQPKFVYDISVKKTQLFVGGQGLVCLHNSVAEEGLDIPTVDLVIFFEPVPSEIRTIQRRGRTGRIEKGKVIILMAKGTRDEAFYWSSLSKEKTMHSTLREMKKELLIKPEKLLEKQETLLSYSEQQEGAVNIFVDAREQASPVVKELREMGCRIHIKQLEIGDYIITDSIVVERKTVKDFLDSIVDGRLFQQLVNLSSNYNSPLFLVEGNISEMFSLREMHRNAIIGALTSIATTYRVPILFTQDAKETAEYIFVIGKREQLGKEKDIRLRVGRKGLSLEEQQQFIVESLPLIGPSMAKKLLKQFGTVEKVFTATEKQLQKIEGMGEKKAKLVRKTVSSKFEKQE